MVRAYMQYPINIILPLIFEVGYGVYSMKSARVRVTLPGIFMRLTLVHTLTLVTL
jgi:hypothetical protein